MLPTLESAYQFAMANARIRLRCLGSFAVLTLLGACTPHRVTQKLPPDREAVSAFPGETKDLSRPRLFTDLASVVTQLNSIVEAEVADVAYSYDPCLGPRSHIVLRNVRSLLGAAHEGTMDLATFGGRLPDGKVASLSELPRFVVGARYILLLRNTDWRFSPVITHHAYRVERLAGRDVLVTTDGFGVTGVSARGIEAASVVVAAPVGINLRGLAPQPATATPQGPFSPCPVGANGKPVCPTSRDATPTNPGTSTQFRYDLPALQRDVSSSDLARLITSDDLIKAVGAFAREHDIRIGGYYASAPRLECWRVTPTARKAGP